ncbi:hypothetical protein L3X38_035618 [Prunus dulcis]|uniref:Uncharacterized protein n=1 Tax=Prunus dulcis TaxID=3755 RepID=A0AAD4YYZ9_PRUDU|nr:hypothetical protein L3X38_035618 [Prunus dulcis]
MQNYFAQYWGNGDVRSKETVMLSYINLLEQLIICVSPHVKDDARKLSNPVESKNGIADTQNSLEHLGFLQFIAKYGLFSTFTRYDIESLLGRISHQNLSFADKIPIRSAADLGLPSSYQLDVYVDDFNVYLVHPHDLL